jgi:CHASE2 domain-containing sensor protein/signal transduction histidine kinase
VFSTVLLFSLVVSGATTRLDNAVYDLSARLMRHAPRADIVIVGIDPKSLATEGQWPWSRHLIGTLIGDIVKDHPRAFAHYFLFLLPGPPEDDQRIHDAMASVKTFLPTPTNPADTSHPGLTMPPIPIIASAATGLGAVDADPDKDGIVRRAFLYSGSQDHLVPRLVLQMARLENPSLDISPASKRHYLIMNNGYRAGEMLVPYLGPKGTFTTVSAADVLNNRVPRDYFRNKFVLVGPTAAGMLDESATPLTSADGMPNVEIDANILNSLLSGDNIYQASKFVTIAISLIFIWTFLVALVRLGPRDNLLFGSATAGISIFGAIACFKIFNYWVPPVSCLVTLTIILPYWGWRRLNAASAYFAKELKVLETEGGLASQGPGSDWRSRGGDVVLQQITLLEDAKRRIADLRKFVDDILANFPDPVFVVDRDGVIARLNSAANLFARSMAFATTTGGHIEPILAAVVASGGDGRVLWPPDLQASTTDGPTEGRPLTGIGPDGRAYELRFTATSGAKGEPTGWIVHLADVTPLVSAMRQREEALQLLSHDMRSPQAAIIAILSHPDFKGAAPALRKRIESQARRTLDLADSFVRLAQAESARYEFEPIDISHVLQDAVDAVWPLAQSAKVKVIFHPEDTEYVVLADRRLLTRALINLLDNAIKFSPEGKSVTCRLRPDHFKSEDSVVCEIADSAGGMAQAQLAELFRKFATSREDVSGSQGVGLGLALVHTVITRHQGVIRCESAEGEGTVFTVALPLYDDVGAEAFATSDM